MTILVTGGAGYIVSDILWGPGRPAPVRRLFRSMWKGLISTCSRHWISIGFVPRLSASKLFSTVKRARKKDEHIAEMMLKSGYFAFGDTCINTVCRWGTMEARWQGRESSM